MEINAQLFYKGAKKLGLPIKYLPDLGYLDIFIGRKHYYFLLSSIPLNEGASVYICKNKFLANQLLLNGGFPVPLAVAFSQADFSRQALHDLIKSLRFPLVAKPMKNSAQGNNVLCNIKDIFVLEEQVCRIFKGHSHVQIEEFHHGLKEYRVLVLKNRVLGVVERFAASITGDGVHSIKELMAISNEQRAGMSVSLTISPLVYDEEYKQCIEEQGLSLQSIIPKGIRIQLCHTVNTGRGGDIVSLGKKIHPKNAILLCKALRVTGLLYGGFDILCEDINQPFSQTKWLIIEINHNPDTTIHEVPCQGIKVSVINKILWQLIFRHPFAYLSHIVMYQASSIYSRMIVITGVLLAILFCLRA